MANYAYPAQIGVIKRKDKTFAVDAKLFPEDGNVSGPLILHAGYSRFVFSIIDKKQNVVPFANIPYSDIDFTKKMSDVICFSKKPENKDGETEISPAFKVKLVGHFRGKTPGHVLLENPSDMEKLVNTKKWLQDNLQKFPPNKEQIDAIDEAIAMFNSGTLIAPSSTSTSSDKEDIYSSEWKFLKSMPGNNNTFLVYNLEIKYYHSNKYPVEIKIENGYAPLSEQAGGQTTIMLSKMENKTSASILLTVKEWYSIIAKAERTLKLFEQMLFKQQYEKMTSIISSYH